MFNRNLLFAVPCLLASFATCFAQTPATFRTETFAQRSSSMDSAIDVNNDGIPDLIQGVVSTGTTSSSFSVRVANGNGSFRAPVIYSMSPAGFSMAFGDFNGDGKIDLVFDLGMTNKLAVFLGNGDGTFQAPKYITVALPSGVTFESPIQAADFNGDGKLDLAAVGIGGSNSIVLIPGNGTGNFGSPSLIYTPPANESVQNSSLGVGDFDGDGRADVALLDEYDCTGGGCTSTVHVLYNNGNSTFTDVATNGTSPDGLNFSTGDLNSDGRTDIFAFANQSNTSVELYVLYGQANRTFHMYTIATAAGAFAMADFNGDTRMDLVGIGSNANGTAGFLDFLLAGTDEGTFTQQTYTLPKYQGYSGILQFSSPVVGDFNSDSSPDALVVMNNGQGNNATGSIIVEALDTTANGNWGGCAYPKAGMGISVCAPSPSTASPVTFNASSNSFGQLRLMELWVDGKKLTDQYHAWGSRAWFDLTGTTLAAGTHQGVMFAKDIDNREQQTVFNFTIGGAACTAPASPGVHICQPASGSSVSSPVQVQATSKVTGTIAHMQLWVDGVNKFTSASTTLTTSISLAAGTHRFAVVATNTAGQKWQSAVNATVK